MAKKYNKINGNLVVDTPKVVTFSTYAAAYQGCLDEDVPQDCLVVVENDGLYIWDWVQVTLTKLTEVGGGGVQPKYVVGDIMQLYGTTAPSDKWLKCDGSAFDTTRYADLYNLLGSGNTPDLNGYVLKGIGNNGNLSTHDSITLGAKLSANMGQHYHAGVSNVIHNSHIYSEGTGHTHTWTPDSSISNPNATNGIAVWDGKTFIPTYFSDWYLPAASQANNSNYALLIESVGFEGTCGNSRTYCKATTCLEPWQYNGTAWCNGTRIAINLANQSIGDTTFTGTNGKIFEIRAMEVSYFIRAEV